MKALLRRQGFLRIVRRRSLLAVGIFGPLCIGFPALVLGGRIVDVNEPARPGAFTSAGSYYVDWWPEPAPVPLNEVFVIHFRVLDPQDRTTPISNAVVTANAWMPEHNHGTALTPRIESHHDGTARAEGFLLHMAGYWQLRVGVAVGGQMERTTFDIHLDP